MTSRKPKTGRRSVENDKKLAREWVGLYRKAQQQPDGRLCLNPSDAWEEQTWLDGNDPEHLIQMLAHFGEHGTFEHVGVLFDSIRVLLLRMDYKKLREAGLTYESAMSALADEAHVTTRTMERWLRTDKS